MTLHARQPAPQGCFSPGREVCSLILNSGSPKSPTLLPGSPGLGHRGAARGALGTRHRSREPRPEAEAPRFPNRSGSGMLRSQSGPSPASLLWLLPQTLPRTGV